MTEFQGIPIDEGALLLHTIFGGIFTVVFFVLVLVVAYTLISEFVESPVNRKKEQNRMKKLQERAESDPIAKKELARRIRKQQKHNKNLRGSIGIHIFLLVFTMLGLIVCIGFYFLPNYQDYTKKDYAVYIGNFEMRYGSRYTDWIVLPDGTMLEENGSIYEEGTYTGTIVYTPRSELVLGIEWEDVS